MYWNCLDFRLYRYTDDRIIQKCLVCYYRGYQGLFFESLTTNLRCLGSDQEFAARVVVVCDVVLHGRTNHRQVHWSLQQSTHKGDKTVSREIYIPGCSGKSLLPKKGKKLGVWGGFCVRKYFNFNFFFHWTSYSTIFIYSLFATTPQFFLLWIDIFIFLCII